MLGKSEKSSADVQLEQFAMAWGMATADRAAVASLKIRIVGDREDVTYEL